MSREAEGTIFAALFLLLVLLLVPFMSRGQLPTATVNGIPGQQVAAPRVMVATFDAGLLTLVLPRVTYIAVPSACTLTSWTLLADSGTAVVDIWKVSGGTALPTSANSITGGKYPSLSSGQVARGSDFTGWTATSVAGGDILGVSLNSVSLAKQVSLTLACQ